MLTERQAWLKIANVCEKRHAGEHPPDFGWCIGLCHCLTELRMQGSITKAVDSRMKNRIPTDRPFGGAYAWDTGDWKSRAAFCRKMAALCKPAKKRLVKAAK